MSERESRPLDAAVLDGLGGCAVLIEKWTTVRRLVANYAKERTQKNKLELEAMLKALAVDLEEDVKHILPARQNSDLWQSKFHTGVLMNPIFTCTLVRARDGLTREAINRVGIEVIDDELVRFLGTADRVLQRLRESPEVAHADAEQGHQTSGASTGGKPIQRGPPVWLKDGSELAPAARTLLLALPAPTWKAAAKNADRVVKENPGYSTVSEGTAASLSKPLQKAGMVEYRDGMWHATTLAQQELARGRAKGRSETPGA